jgi:hypothetical protein
MDLARALRDFQREWGMDEVSATKRLSDSHELTMHWSGDILHLEREDGHVIRVDGAGIG